MTWGGRAVSPPPHAHRAQQPMWRIGSQIPPSRMMIPWPVAGAGATVGDGVGAELPVVSVAATAGALASGTTGRTAGGLASAPTASVAGRVRSIRRVFMTQGVLFWTWSFGPGKGARGDLTAG